MKLKCLINTKEYDIVQGASFAEEFNETLDSGSIIITHVPMMRDLKPYDDVFIWDCSKHPVFCGYDNDKIFFENEDGKKITYTYNEDNFNFERFLQEGKKDNIFFKHLLIDDFSETMINVKDLDKEIGVLGYEPIYDYRIQLFSETKSLEVIQLPNISITQPLKYSNKKSVWEYLEQYIELYSPLYKKINDKEKKTWKFERKYSISSSLKIIFENSFSPDFTLNNPSLKDVIAKLMLVKDMIPYVKNDVIYAMNITERKSTFDKNPKYVNNINGVMTSNDYCDNLKKTYSDGLSQDSLSHSIEYIGFRNSDSALLTLGNMRLETRFPIYKINKIYMCYYKKIKYVNRKTNVISDGYFLCKQDITPFVRLNTERNLLSQDWSKLDLNSSISEASKYRMMTVGYDIGSNYITGWGEKYTYPAINSQKLSNGFWDITKSYIENIFTFFEHKQPYGIYSYDYIKKTISPDNYNDIFLMDAISDVELNSMICPVFGDNNSTKQKGFVFQVDYQAFYNGTIVHTKDNGRDNITINDNPSSSLTLLEQDGIFTKEKANRFGNKGLTINARYDNVSQLQELGSVYDDYNNYDVIIYHREYQIWDNYVLATYYGMHDYVLKNYFTNVYARHRTWNLMSYSESIRRSENRKTMMLLSKNNCYFEDFNDSTIKQKKFAFNNFIKVLNNPDENGNEISYSDASNEIANIISAFHETNYPTSINNFINKYDLNYAFLTYESEDEEGNLILSKYAVDVNSFVSGNSLCVNLSMPDNVSAGTYILKPSPDNFKESKWTFSATFGDNSLTLPIGEILNLSNLSKTSNDYAGSVQDWHRISDKTTGNSKKMGFYAGHINSLLEIENDKINTPDLIEDVYNKYLFKLPDLTTYIKEYEIDIVNQIGNEFDIYKDNKELIDMTYQIEPISDNKDVMFSPWFMKLSDIVSKYNKFDVSQEYKETNRLEYSGSLGEIYQAVIIDAAYAINSAPTILIKVLKSDIEFLNYSSLVSGGVKPDIDGTSLFLLECTNDIASEGNAGDSADLNVYITYYMMYFEKINYIDSTKMTATISEQFKGRLGVDDRGEVKHEEFVFETPVELNVVDNINGVALPKDDNYVWYMLKRVVSNIPNYAPSSGKQTRWGAGFTSSDDYIIDLYSNVYDEIPINKFKNLGKDVVKPDETILNFSGDISELYYKNMFLVASNNLKKDTVYNQYGFVLDFSPILLYEKGDYCLYDSKLYLYSSETPSYGTFDSEKWNEISNTYVYNNHFFKIGEDSDYWKNKSFEILSPQVTDVFKVTKINDKQCIKVDLSSFNYQNGDPIPFESIQYYFLDNNSLNFVFGCNLTQQDWNNGYAIIFISMLSTRDTRIYDENHMIKAKTLNFANDTVPTYVTNGQYYGIPNTPEYNIEFIDDNAHYTYKIERLESSYGNGELKALDINDIVYYGDKLKITIYPNEEYNFSKLIINNEEYDNGQEFYVYEKIEFKAILSLNEKWVNIMNGETIEFSESSSGFQKMVINIGDGYNINSIFRISGKFYYMYNGVEYNEEFNNLTLEKGVTNLELLSFGGVNLSETMVIQSSLYLNRPSNLLYLLIQPTDSNSYGLRVENLILDEYIED